MGQPGPVLLSLVFHPIDERYELSPSIPPDPTLHSAGHHDDTHAEHGHGHEEEHEMHSVLGIAAVTAWQTIFQYKSMSDCKSTLGIGMCCC